MARVHRLQHVERRLVANLTDDDAIRAHPQRIANEVTNAHLTAPFDVRRAGLEAEHVLLMELQLGGILDGHDALVARDERGQHVERGGLSGPRTTGDENVEAAFDAGVQEIGHHAGQRSNVTRSSATYGSVANFRMVSREPSTARGGMIALTRLPSGGRASHIGLASSTRRPTRPDLVDGAPQAALVGEAPRHRMDAPGALDVDPIRSIDHDLGDVDVAKEGLEWAIAQRCRRRPLERCGSGRRS